MLLFTQEVGDTALPSAFESGGEETLFQKGHLGLHCLNGVHPGQSRRAEVEGKKQVRNKSHELI